MNLGKLVQILFKKSNGREPVVQDYSTPSRSTKVRIIKMKGYKANEFVRLATVVWPVDKDVYRDRNGRVHVVNNPYVDTNAYSYDTNRA